MTVKMTGIREAKARLSRLLRDVQRGHEWVITERIRRLEDSGLIEPVRPQTRKLPPPLPLEEGLAQAWLQEDRNLRSPTRGE